MSRAFIDHNKDVDSEAAAAYRHAFIAKMERKYEFKKSLRNPNYAADRYLIR